MRRVRCISVECSGLVIVGKAAKPSRQLAIKTARLCLKISTKRKLPINDERKGGPVQLLQPRVATSIGNVRTACHHNPSSFHRFVGNVIYLAT